MQFAGFSSPTRNRGAASRRSSLRSPLRPFNYTSISMICQTPISSSTPSGEIRLSGFLLWQSAFSEFYFTDADRPRRTPRDPLSTRHTLLPQKAAAVWPLTVFFETFPRSSP